MTTLPILKRQVAGYRTSFNNKIDAASNLAKQVAGPPVNRAPIIVKQLQARVVEVENSYAVLKKVIDQIINVVVKDDDTANYDHYTKYLDTVSQEFEQVRNALVVTLADVETIPVPTPKDKDSDDESDSDDGGGGGARRARSPLPKAVSDLKPPVLKKGFEKSSFSIWLRKLKAYFNASHFEKLPILSQQEYVRSCVSDDLMRLIEADIGEETPVFPDTDRPELSSLTEMLDNEITARNPVMSRRLKFFQSRMSKTNTFSQYVAYLREIGNFCHLEELDPNGILIFLAISTINDDYVELLDDILKVKPEELTLKKLLQMSKIFESSNVAKKSMKKHDTAQRTYNGGGAGSAAHNGGGSSSSTRYAGSRQSITVEQRAHEQKLRNDKRCTKCAVLLSTEKHSLPCHFAKVSCFLCKGAHSQTACVKYSPEKAKKPQKKTKYQKDKFQSNARSTLESRASNDEDDSPAIAASSDEDCIDTIAHVRGVSDGSSSVHAVINRCSFTTESSRKWLKDKPKSARKGSYPTPRLKMTFFQRGGNCDLPWDMYSLPDTGCSRSLLTLNTVKKYNLIYDNSKSARSHRLLNASSQEMKVAGVADLQCRYNGETIHLDCLVVSDNIGCPAYISWHDLQDLGIIKIPCDASCNQCSIKGASLKKSHKLKKLQSKKLQNEITPFAKFASNDPNDSAKLNVGTLLSAEEQQQQLQQQQTEQASTERGHTMKAAVPAFDPRPSNSSTVRQKIVPAECFVQNDSVKKIVKDFKDVLGHSIGPQPMQGYPDMTIHLKDDIPIIPTRVTHAIRTPLHLRKSSDDCIQNLIDNNVVKRLTADDPPSDWLLSGFYVRKSASKPKVARLVVNAKPLNLVIKRRILPFLPAAEVLQLIPPTAKFFCVLDLKDSYFLIKLDEKSSKMCTFLTDQGNFRFLRAPQGVSTSGAELLARLNDGLRHCRDTISLIDDVCCFAANLKDLYANVRNVLLRCRTMRVTMGLDKLQVIMPGEHCLFGGFKLSSLGLQADERKLLSIQNFPVPTDRQSVRSWLGLVQQLASFVPNLSEITAGLRILLKERTAFLWTQAQEDSFIATKKLLNSDLIRKPYDETLPPENTCCFSDGSFNGIGGGLFQLCPKTGRYNLIQCVSRSLAPCEQRYATIEIECLSLTFVISRMKYYLYNLPGTFTSFTDHKPLLGTFKKDLTEIENPRLLRLREKMLAYNFTVSHLAGRKMAFSDALSRYPVEKPNEDDEEIEEIANCRVTYSDPLLDNFKEVASLDQNYQLILAALENHKLLQNLPPHHPAHNFKSYWHLLSVDDKLIIFDGHRLVVPKALQAEIIERLHELHAGKTKTKIYARSKYFWPQMSNDIDLEIEQCTKCLNFLPSQPAEILKPMIATEKMQIIDTDLFEIGNINYVVCVDRYSSFPFAKRIKNKTCQAVIDFLLPIFYVHGFPRILFADGGGCYIGSLFDEFLRAHGIVLQHSSPRHPSSNAVAESAGVKNVKRLAQKTGNEKDFQKALAAFRNCPRTDGPSPAEMFFDRKLREPNLPTLPNKDINVSEGLKQRMLTKIARSEKSENRRDLSKLEVGTLVLIQNAESHLWDSTGRIVSIHDAHERSYWIKKIGGRKLIRRNRIHLRPLNETKKISKRPIEFNPELKKISDLKGDQSGELDTIQPEQQEALKPLTTEQPTLRRSERIRNKTANTTACNVHSCSGSCPYSKKK